MDALGRLDDRRDKTELGLAIIDATAADAEEVIVVIKNTWMTWKKKYEFCTRSSMLESDGFPPSLAINLRMIGSKAISTASNMDGSRP